MLFKEIFQLKINSGEDALNTELLDYENLINDKFNTIFENPE